MTEISAWKVGARTFSPAELIAEARRFLARRNPAEQGIVEAWLVFTPQALTDIAHLPADAYAAKHGTSARRAVLAFLAGMAATIGMSDADCN